MTVTPDTTLYVGRLDFAAMVHNIAVLVNKRLQPDYSAYGLNIDSGTYR